MQRRAFVRLVGGGSMPSVRPWRAAARRCRPRPWRPGRGRAPSPTCGAGCSARHPGAAFAQPAVLAGGPAHAGRDHCCAATATRLLPETDPFGRQIMMSHGTFLELLDLAARERGQRAEITLCSRKASSAPSASTTGRWRACACVPDAGVARDPLFAQILHRRTNRNAYDLHARCPTAPGRRWPRPCSVAGCASATRPQPTRRSCRATAPSPPRPGASRWSRRAAMLESYKVLRVGAAEIARHRDGLSLTDPMVVALARLGLFDRSKAPAPDSRVTPADRRLRRQDRLDPGLPVDGERGNAAPRRSRPAAPTRACSWPPPRTAWRCSRCSRRCRSTRSKPAPTPPSTRCCRRRRRRTRCRCGRAWASPTPWARRRGADVDAMPLVKA
jgi:hypothetical protein